VSKLTQFKARAAAHGQAITVYPFSAFPSGSYVDTWSSEPDPGSASYPSTQPSITYGTAVTVNGFFQPPSGTEAKEEVMITAPWGDQVKVAARAYLPGDQAVQHRDKIVVGGVNYWVAGIAPWKDSTVTVINELQLVQSVPRA
jgi:hypothetical protein